MEHLLGAHFEDHIGMGAHPHAARRDLTQQCVEIGAVTPLVNRIDPDEYAIKSGEPWARAVEDIVLIDYRFRIDTDLGERCEHGPEPAGLGRDTAARRLLTPPEDSDAAEASCGLKHAVRSPSVVHRDRIVAEVHMAVGFRPQADAAPYGLCKR